MNLTHEKNEQRMVHFNKILIGVICSETTTHKKAVDLCQQFSHRHQ